MNAHLVLALVVDLGGGAEAGEDVLDRVAEADLGRQLPEPVQVACRGKGVTLFRISAATVHHAFADARVEEKDRHIQLGKYSHFWKDMRSGNFRLNFF